jgi:beta-xylosidase
MTPFLFTLALLIPLITESPLFLGDPFILNDKGVYYLYGTNANDGIKVYRSTNLKHWTGPCGVKDGLALHKDDIWGAHSFWAPEVYRIGERYFMFVSVEKHMAIATSDTPMGPFVQTEKGTYETPASAIDHHLCQLGEQPMIFFVSFEPRGLEIWSAELEDDLMSIRQCTFSRCTYHCQDWEYEIVNEGPFILQEGVYYYLVYSGNGYESQDYGLGFAVSKSLRGPWIKHPDNPFFQRPGNLVGVGHCSFFYDQEEQLKIVYHSHFDQEKVHPRKVHVNDVLFVDDENYEYRIPRVDTSNLNPVTLVQ